MLSQNLAHFHLFTSSYIVNGEPLSPTEVPAWHDHHVTLDTGAFQVQAVPGLNGITSSIALFHSAKVPIMTGFAPKNVWTCDKGK